MATFVLVPGGFVGGWSWKKVTPFLRAAGHEVYTPTPTGLGERVHLATPDVDLETHVADVVNLLVYEDLWEVTLVGYSSGVTLAAAVAERAPERLAQVIYMDSVVPADGQSNYDAIEVDEAERAEERSEAEAAGTPGYAPVPVDYVRANIADEADREWFLARMAPHPIAACTQPVRIGNPGAAALPRAFVFTTVGKNPEHSVARFAARVRADPGWRYREVAANHLAPVTAPRELAEAFLSLV